MIYESKHFFIYLGDTYLEDPPNLFIDWYYARTNRRTGYKSFTMDIGVFGKHLVLAIRWGFVTTKEELWVIHLKMQELVIKFTV